MAQGEDLELKRGSASATEKARKALKTVPQRKSAMNVKLQFISRFGTYDNHRLVSPVLTHLVVLQKLHFPSPSVLNGLRFKLSSSNSFRRKCFYFGALFR